MKAAFFRFNRTLHWISSAIGLASLVFFSITGITLNHPDWFSADRAVEVQEVAMTGAWMTQFSAEDELGQLALWLEQEKWHRDLRSWWRRGGKSLALPVDGVSGATRRPGSYTVQAGRDLPAGEYTLNVEAVREVGGREHLRLPFTWTGRPLAGEAGGKTELGRVRYTIKENE